MCSMCLKILPLNGIFNKILNQFKGTFCVPFFIFTNPYFGSYHEKKHSPFCSFYLTSKAQNVGIGTSNPTALLEVAGGDAKVNSLLIGRGGGNILSNVVLGDSALINNIDGIHNTAIGTNSLSSNTTGSNNIALGNDAGIRKGSS